LPKATVSKKQAKGEVNDNHQNDGTGDIGKRRIYVYCNHSKGTGGKGNDANDNGSLRHQICFNFEGWMKKLEENW
jgi:hypothetical protein